MNHLLSSIDLDKQYQYGNASIIAFRIVTSLFHFQWYFVSNLSQIPHGVLKTKQQ